jgi:hypothetical protein
LIVCFLTGDAQPNDENSATISRGLAFMWNIEQKEEGYIHLSSLLFRRCLELALSILQVIAFGTTLRVIPTGEK